MYIIKAKRITGEVLRFAEMEIHEVLEFLDDTLLKNSRDWSLEIKHKNYGKDN